MIDCTASNTPDAVAFITALLECSPAERSTGDEHVWTWAVDETDRETVHVVGTHDAQLVVFVDVSGLEVGQPKSVLHSAIIGWCVRSKVLCIVDQWGDRYAVLPRKVSEVGADLPRVVHRGSRRMH